MASLSQINGNGPVIHGQALGLGIQNNPVIPKIDQVAKQSVDAQIQPQQNNAARIEGAQIEGLPQAVPVVSQIARQVIQPQDPPQQNNAARVEGAQIERLPQAVIDNRRFKQEMTRRGYVEGNRQVLTPSGTFIRTDDAVNFIETLTRRIHNGERLQVVANAATRRFIEEMTQRGLVADSIQILAPNGQFVEVDTSYHRSSRDEYENSSLQYDTRQRIATEVQHDTSERGNGFRTAYRVNYADFGFVLIGDVWLDPNNVALVRRHSQAQNGGICVIL